MLRYVAPWLFLTMIQATDRNLDHSTLSSSLVSRYVMPE